MRVGRDLAIGEVGAGGRLVQAFAGRAACLGAMKVIMEPTVSNSSAET